MSLYKVTTVNGHLLPEVVSALQKRIRRGQVDDALYWAVDMYLTGYDEYAWKRLRIMASEDVGPAEPNLPATIEALYQTYTDLKKKKDETHAPQRLQLVHAVILLATARKNRVVDHALIHHFGNHATLKRDIPDWRAGQAHGAGGSGWAVGQSTSSRKGSSWRTRAGMMRTGIWRDRR